MIEFDKIEVLTALVNDKKISHQSAIHIYAQLTLNQKEPPTLNLPCEECGKITPLTNIVSYKMWVAMPGNRLVSGFDEHDQHFCCSHDCARKQLLKCFDEHLRPEAENRCALVKE